MISWFWEVVHGFTEAQKKRLLMFVTGSDRVPIKGLASLQPPFVISRNGPSSDRLPTAHTCFNHLLLPAYKASPDSLLSLVDGSVDSPACSSGLTLRCQCSSAACHTARFL